MSDDDLFSFMGHARSTDPLTSHEAVPTDINERCLRVLRAYRTSQPLLDHDACRLAGFDDGITHQRCSDLRAAGMIARTGERGRTPSGKAGYLCRITEAGLAYLARAEQ